MNQSGSLRSRVLLLELDSLSLQMVRDNLDRLPNMSRLIDRQGDLVETKTTADIASATVWPTFSSGNLPGVHGHYFPFQWHPDDMRYYRPHLPNWGGQLDYEPFWYELARRGLSCQVLDAQQFVPHADSPCLEINDWSNQSSGTAHTTDRQVLRQLRRNFGKRPIRPEVPVIKSSRLSARVQAQVLDSMKRKTDAIVWLGRRKDWRFYLASIQDVHRAGHNLWHVEEGFASSVDAAALLEVYEAMDREVGRILEALVDDRTFVILFTLNGMAANRAQNHFLHQVLERLNTLYLSGHTQPGVSSRRSGIMAKLRDGVPAGLQYRTALLLGEKIQDWVVNRELTGSLAWSSTPSFPVATGGEGLVRLNIEGRERDGMLTPGDETRAYVDWLKERLLEIRVARNGEPLIREVLDIHGQYPGDRTRLLPDLALQWSPDKPATEISSPAIGTVRQSLKTGRGGNHTGESFAILPAKVRSTAAADGLKHIKDYRGLVNELLA